MATQVQLRRGTATENNSFTGAQGELTFDTTNKRVRIHDGATAGGFELKTENSSGDTLFADNEKAIFGAGSDLQIYHDPAAGHSYIAESGTGSLIIKGQNLRLRDASDNNYVFAESGGAVTLYNNNAAKLATTSTGIDVTGRITTDAITEDTSGNVGIGVVPETWNSANNGLQVGPRAAIFGTDSGYSGFSNNQYQATDGSAKYIVTAPASIINLDPDSTIKFRQAASGTADTAITWSEAMRITSGGNVGIGTSSPSSKFVISDGGAYGFEFLPNNSSLNQVLSYDRTASVYRDYKVSANQIIFGYGQTGANEAMRIDSIGRVGIGTSSPEGDGLHVQASDNNNDDDLISLGFTFDANSKVLGTIGVHNSAADTGGLKFSTKNAGTLAERMRLDSSGNLLVGTTDVNIRDSSTTDGLVYRTGNSLDVTNNGNTVAIFNRNTSDGEIVTFRKGAADVGSIGTVLNPNREFLIESNTGQLLLGVSSSSNRVEFDGDQLYPSPTGSANLGHPNVRWQDLYLSGGVYLGGTGAANKLDDYEEGSYTATLNVTGGSISYSSNTLSYTKIGRMVFVNGRILVSSVSSPTGPLQISLPFAVSVSGYSRYSQLTITFYSVDVNNTAIQNMFTVESGSAGNWLQSGDNAAWSVLTNSVLSGNEQIQVSGFYLTDS